MCLRNLFLLMDVFYIYTYRYPFGCAMKCICDKSHLYINHNTFLNLCAFIIKETVLTPLNSQVEHTPRCVDLPRAVVRWLTGLSPPPPPSFINLRGSNGGMKWIETLLSFTPLCLYCTQPPRWKIEVGLLKY